VSTTSGAAVLDRPPDGPGGDDGWSRPLEDTGGVAARRAVVRWGWRLFRREWRQQLLVLTLLTFAVAVAVGGSAALYATLPNEDGALGGADLRIDLPDVTGSAVAEKIAAARSTFGAVDPIGVTVVVVPGSVERVDLRAQDPAGAYSGPMLRLLSGRYPDGADEIAVTDRVASLLGVATGDTVEVGGRERTVVGRVENPADLGDEFALAPISELDRSESLSLLVDGSREQLEAFNRATPGGMGVQLRGDDGETTGAVLLLSMTTVVLLLVSLIAAAGFVVVAQRRMRQLGMLAAIGATEKHLRLVMVANGAAVGIVAATVGGAIGLGAWIAAAGHLEEAFGRRIDPLGQPW